MIYAKNINWAQRDCHASSAEKEIAGLRMSKLTTYLENIDPVRRLLPQIQPEQELGAEGRLGISCLIHDEMMYHYVDNPKFMEHHRLRLRQQLGLEIFNHVVIRPNPVTVRIVERIERRDYEYGFVLSYIADLQNVETMKNFMLDLPPFEFISYGKPTPVVEWQCLYCGQCNLVIENLECRKCGAPRKPIR